MANNRRQGFRSVRANALRPVWGGLLHVPHIRMLDAYNEALASGACVCGIAYCFSERVREKAQLRLISLVGWATLCERGGVFPCGRLPYTCSAWGPRQIVLRRLLQSSPIHVACGAAEHVFGHVRHPDGRDYTKVGTSSFS
jgi:hypothetical protein